MNDCLIKGGLDVQLPRGIGMMYDRNEWWGFVGENGWDSAQMMSLQNLVRGHSVDFYNNMKSIVVEVFCDRACNLATFISLLLSVLFPAVIRVDIMGEV